MAVLPSAVSAPSSWPSPSALNLGRAVAPALARCPPHRPVPPAGPGDGPTCPASAALPRAASGALCPGTRPLLRGHLCPSSSDFLSPGKPPLPAPGALPLLSPASRCAGRAESGARLPTRVWSSGGCHRECQARALPAAALSCLSTFPAPSTPGQPPVGLACLPVRTESWEDPWRTSRANGQRDRPLPWPPSPGRPPCSDPAYQLQAELRSRLCGPPSSPAPPPGLAFPTRPRHPSTRSGCSVATRRSPGSCPRCPPQKIAGRAAARTPSSAPTEPPRPGLGGGF